MSLTENEAKMIREFYGWGIGLAQTSCALRALATLAVTEGSVPSLPPDVLILAREETIC
jgi:hypothetical protein